MAYSQSMRLPDGQELLLYNDGNTKKGSVRMDGTSLLIGADGDIHIASATNLLLKGTTATIGGVSGVNSTLSLGTSGDRINLNVSGVTYNVATLTGSPTVTGSMTINGGATIKGGANVTGGALTASSMTGTVDATDLTLYYARDGDYAKIHFVDYGVNQDWLTFDFGDDLGQDRVRFRTTTGVTVLDVISNAIESSVTVKAPAFTENGTLLTSKYLGISAKAADSDKLDGVDSTQFMRKDTPNTLAGNQEFYGTNTGGDYSSAPIEIREVNVVGSAQTANAYAPALTFHWGARGQVQLALESNGVLVLRDGVTHTSYRTLNTGGLQVNGSNVWHSGNFTPGSKLDNAGGTLTGDLTISKTNAKLKLYEPNATVGNYPSIEFDTLNNQGVQIQFNEHDTEILDAKGYALVIKKSDSNTGPEKASLIVEGSIYSEGSKVWHAGNQGTGSGLDADLLDGKNSSEFAPVVHTHQALSIPDTRGVATTPSEVPSYTLSAEFKTSTAVNNPPVSTGSSYSHILNMNAWNSANTGGGGHTSQLAFGDGLAIRLSTSTTTWGPWRKIWHDGIFDPETKTNKSTTLTGGTGITTVIGDLSANRTISFDTSWGDGRYLGKTATASNSTQLGGLAVTSFLRSNANDTFTGILTLAGSQTISGTLAVTGKVTLDDDLAIKKVPYISGVAGTHRENGQINLLTRMSGRILNKNPDFLNGTISDGYSTYDNNHSGRIVRTIVSDDVVPNSSGKLMRISYDPARNATVGTTPGFGGFLLATFRGTADLTGWNYKAGNRYVHRIVAKIPVGRNIDWVSNATGTGGEGRWMTSQAGTGNWDEYIYLQTIGTTGTFSATSYYIIIGGTDTAFTWDVSMVQIIGIDEAPDADRAPTLNVGYKPGVDLGWGELYATGRIRSDSSIESGGDFVLKTTGAVSSPSGASYMTPLNTSGNFMLRATESNKAMYLDADNTYFRSAAGANQVTIDPSGNTVMSGLLTVKKNVSVEGDLIIPKTSGISAMNFPPSPAGNDAGYIQHREVTSNVAEMRFSVSDDAVDSDFFTFGATPSGVYKEGARIGGAGSASFKATDVSSLDVSGNARIVGNLDLPTTAPAPNALKIGQVSIGQAVGNSGQLIITNLDQLRFGSTTSATWDYNKWGGIKYITGSDTMVIGGAASANFLANGTAAPRISLNFEGLKDSSFDGKVVINPTTVTSIGGATMANGYLLLGTAANGLAMDSNELYFSGEAGIIGSVGAHDLYFRPNGTDRVTMRSNGNVGIGTTTPKDLLEINVPARGTVLTGTAAYGGIHLNQMGGADNYTGITSSSDGPLSTQAGVMFQGSGSYGTKIHFMTTNSHANGMQNRMTLDNSGNLGIGTTTPSQRLHVNGNILAGAITATGGYSGTTATFSGNVSLTGTAGIVFSTHGGGWNMTDTTWIRATGSKSLYMASGTIRTDGTLQVGATASNGLSVTDGAFNWKNGSLYAATTGKVSINQASNTEHPLHVKSNGSYQGINIQNSAYADVSGLSFQNYDGKYSWHMATSNVSNSDMVFYGSSVQASMSALGESVRFTAAGGVQAKHHITTPQNLYVGGGSGLNHAPGIDLAIGDSDTGFDWVSDGKFQLKTNSAARMTFDAGATQVHNTLAVDSNVTADGHMSLLAGNGRAFRFWNSDSYRIHMSSGAGNMPWVSNADYNMYFEMGSTNRGFAFVNPTQGGVNAQIEGNGRVNSNVGFRAKKFEMAYNATEDSLDFIYYV